MNATVHNVGTALSRHPADLVASHRVTGVDADFQLPPDSKEPMTVLRIALMPNALRRDLNVDAFIPSSSAAPSPPAILQLVCSRAAIRFSRSIRFSSSYLTIPLGLEASEGKEEGSRSRASEHFSYYETYELSV